MLRFAPSPTGDMNIETLRSAIVNYLISQQKNESFIVRIDDRDTQRNIEGKDTEIMQVLEKFALTHESVFHQSEHLHMHQTLAIKLLEQNKAFVCTCTDEEIEADKAQSKANKIPYHYNGKCANKDKSSYSKLKEESKPFVIRLKKPENAIVTHDLIQGESITSPDEVDAFIIMHADSTPSDNFACACDDMLSGITMIIRSEDHLSNTPKQKHIKTQLGYEEKTIYAHLPIILNSDDAYLVQWMFKEGFVPDAIINYLLLMGYTNAPKEVFTLPEAIKWFDIKNISKSTVKFDICKLRFINRSHLMMMEDKQLSTLFGFADECIGKLAKLYLQEVSTIRELEMKIKPIFTAKNFEGPWAKEMKSMANIIENAPIMSDYTTFESYMMKVSGLKDEHFFTPLRYLLTGVGKGPELSDIYPLIKSYLLEVAS